MPPYAFRLSAVLRIREAIRDERRGQLAEALRIAQSLDTQLGELHRDLAQLKREQTIPVGAVDVDRLLSAGRYEAVLEIERRRLDEQQQAVAAEIEKRRELLVAADRDVRALELLRQRQDREHQTSDQRRLARQMDEATAARHASNRDEPLTETA